MQIGALITTVNHPQKQQWLPMVANSIDIQECKFDYKLISVDNIIENQEFSSDIYNELVQKGWEFHFLHNSGRMDTLIQNCKFFEFKSMQFILHAEDDILIDYLPNREELENFLSIRTKDNRECGQLTMSLGGSTYRCEGDDNGDFDQINNLILFEDNHRILWERSENFASPFFVELGTMFINPSLMHKCLFHAKYNFSGQQIETAQTKAWFNLELHRKYYRATLCKPSLKTVYKIRPNAVDKECRFITILDPHQGASLYGGNHTT